MILLAEGLGGGGGSAFLAESFTAISTRLRTASSCPRHFRSSVEACPHDYRWHSWKNATQMPAMIVRLTTLLPESAAAWAQRSALAAVASARWRAFPTPGVS